MKDFFKLKEAIHTKAPMLSEQAAQVTVGDYTTKHFDICPSAVELYSNIAGKTEMNHLVVETMMLQDVFFRLEKQAIAMGYIDEEELDKAQHYADMIMDNADQMGLLDEHDYIENVHMEKFRELSEIEMEDEDYDNEEEDEDEDEMNEKTLTPAELKKREEIAKAIKRENPRMPMAQKMAIATATAKKVAEKTEPSLKETKGAPPGYHFTRDGKLKRGDAGQDGPGGRMLRADPLDKQRSKIPPVSEKNELTVYVMKEVEQIDEISNKMKDRYIRKAVGDHQHANAVRKDAEATGKTDLAAKMKARMKKRNQGMTRAFGGERIDEISKKTLGSYATKALNRADIAARMSKSGSDEMGKIADKRTAGVKKAVDRIAGKKTASSIKSNIDKAREAARNKGTDKDDQGKAYYAAQKGISKVREEVDLDEAIEVSHDRYMRSHGKKASGGEGNWMFTHKRMGDANVNDPKEVHSARGKFSDAKKSAQQWAKKHGHSTVYVMEEVNLDEASKEHLERLKSMLDKAKPGSADHSQIRHAISAQYGDEHIPAKHRNVKPDMYEAVEELEDFEQIDELKKSTLGSYIKKASARAVSDKTTADRLNRRAFDTDNSGDSEKYFDASDRMQKKYKNRLAGISKATDRLTKEEVEQIDEISADLAHDVYKKRMAQAKAHIQQDNYSAARKAEKKAGDTSLRMVKKILKRPS